MAVVARAVKGYGLGSRMRQFHSSQGGAHASAFLRVKTMIEPIKQEWVADSDIQQGKLVWIGHDMRARLTLSVQGVPPTGYNWEAESDVKAGETGTFIRREKRRAHA